MKYAGEIIECLMSFPKGEFCCVKHLVRILDPDAPKQRKAAVRRQVIRVLEVMIESGSVVTQKRSKERVPSRFAWAGNVNGFGLKIPGGSDAR